VRAAAPDVAGWTNTDELLAALVEVVDYGNRLYLQVHAKKGSRPPKPIQIRRPGQPEAADPPKKKRRQATGEEMRRFFAPTGV
jgi:hypothetical protein